MRSIGIPLREDARRCGRSSFLRGLPASGGSERLFPARDERGMNEAGGRFAPSRQQEVEICRTFSGSDGTRTRDLRRDRLVPRRRRLATDGHAIALFMRLCGLPAPDLCNCVGSILGVCCPSAARAFVRWWAGSALRALFRTRAETPPYHGGFGASHAYTRDHLRHRFSCKSNLLGRLRCVARRRA